MRLTDRPSVGQVRPRRQDLITRTLGRGQVMLATWTSGRGHEGVCMAYLDRDMRKRAAYFVLGLRMEFRDQVKNKMRREMLLDTTGKQEDSTALGWTRRLLFPSWWNRRPRKEVV